VTRERHILAKESGMATNSDERPVPEKKVEDDEKNILARYRSTSRNGIYVGLALSGGGVRSATFSLGVLRAFAAREWIRNFDYLSTVSGGGYIGCWLSAWIYHCRQKLPRQDDDKDGHVPPLSAEEKECARNERAIEEVEKKLVDNNTPEIKDLRSYSNYLTPHVGMFGGDTLAILAGWLLNLVLTLFVSVMFIVVVVAALHLLIALGFDVLRSYWKLGVFTVVATCALYVSFFFINVYLACRPDDSVSSADGAIPRGNEGFQWFLHKEHLFVTLPLQFGLIVGGIAIMGRNGPVEWKTLVLPALVILAVLFLIGNISLHSHEMAALIMRWWRENEEWFLCVAFLVIPFLAATVLGIHVYAGWRISILAAVSMLIIYFLLCIGVTGHAKTYLPHIWRHFFAAAMCVLVAYLLIKVFVPAVAPATVAAVKLPNPRLSLEGALKLMIAGPVFAIAGFWLLYIVWMWNIGSTYSHYSREWLNRQFGALIRTVIYLLVAGGIILHGALVWDATGRIWDMLGKTIITGGGWHAFVWKTWHLIAAVLAGMALAVYWLMRRAIRKVGKTRKASSDLLHGLSVFLMLMTIIGLFIGITVAYQNALIAHFSLCNGSSNAGPTHFARLECAMTYHDNGEKYWQGAQWHSIFEFVYTLPYLGGFILILALYLLSWPIDPNTFSLQNLYRNRLVRCYLGAANQKQERRSHQYAALDPEDDLDLHLLGNQRPYHLINATLNVTERNLVLQHRKAASFVFSPLYCGFSHSHEGTGGSASGYVPTEKFASEYDGRGHESRGVKTGAAMATSGAALSSQMGPASRDHLAFILTMFNVRLGRWVPNPVRHYKARTHRGWLAERIQDFSVGKYLWELFNMTGTRSDWVYVSDGGHFDNLGIYELVRRRCKLIVCVDATADPNCTFDALEHTVRKCRIDFNANFVVDLTPLKSDAEGYSSDVFATGVIDYAPRSPVDTEVKGHFVYIKPSIPAGCAGALPPDILGYWRRHPQFPHQPTLDQWFTEEQFESYLKLGFEIGLRAQEKADRILQALPSQGKERRATAADAGR
jgi:hypothetical protein